MTQNLATRLTTGAAAWLFAACALLTLASHPARAADPSNRLEAVDVQTLPGQQLQLTLRLAGPAPEPLTFTIDNPARISIDLPNTALALPSRRIDVRSAGVDTILAAEASGRTRLVLNMDQLVPYQTRVSGNTVTVTLGAGQQAAAVPASVGKPAMASSEPRAIRSVDFRRGNDGAGRLIVKLSDPRTPINLRQLGNQIVVDFAGADVAKSLVRRYDALDFATPVAGFDVMRVGDSSRIVINANGDFEQLAYQSDDQYVVEVQPARKAAAPTEEKRVYTGERLTLNFQDIETRAVLQLLADASGQNIVVSDSVSGNVTLRLQSVPWDQALDIVLRTKGLDKRRQGNVIIVAPTDELANREKAELAARKDVQELAPLRTEFLQVNYAKADDLATLIKGGAGSSLLSPRGSVAVDERTNMLLVNETADRLAEIRQLVGSLDIPVRQVLIEARIVIVNDDFSRELGVRAGYTHVDLNSDGRGVGILSGSASATDVGLEEALTTRNASGSVTSVKVPVGAAGAPQRYNVNLPGANPAGRIAAMLLNSNFIVDLELSAAQAEGRGEIVSSPRVITANQKEAVIEQGTEIPYLEASSSGAATISFKKAVLSLKVTPQITPDNRIILDLDIKKDSIGQIFQGEAGSQIPSIDTREVTTQVLVNDGQTVVLGGILETERRHDEKKVPYLGDLPGVGALFRTRSKTDDKDELLIFITPKILREGVNVY